MVMICDNCGNVRDESHCYQGLEADLNGRQ